MEFILLERVAAIFVGFLLLLYIVLFFGEEMVFTIIFWAGDVVIAFFSSYFFIILDFGSISLFYRIVLLRLISWIFVFEFDLGLISNVVAIEAGVSSFLLISSSTEAWPSRYCKIILISVVDWILFLVSEGLIIVFRTLLFVVFIRYFASLLCLLYTSSCHFTAGVGCSVM